MRSGRSLPDPPVPPSAELMPQASDDTSRSSGRPGRHARLQNRPRDGSSRPGPDLAGSVPTPGQPGLRLPAAGLSAGAARRPARQPPDPGSQAGHASGGQPAKAAPSHGTTESSDEAGPSDEELLALHVNGDPEAF